VSALPAPVLRKPPVDPIMIRHRGKRYTCKVVAVCGACGIGPVVELPPEIASEPANVADGTDHACAACGHGFSSKLVGEL
jgi:hypothetical protein